MASVKWNSAMTNEYILRPGITNPDLWYPERPPDSQWKKIRKTVLDRDGYACAFCSHTARKYMNVHHLEETGEHVPENLITTCVACHAVLHMGRNLSLGTIEIWESEISQVEIVQRTRAGVKAGDSLRSIKEELPIQSGRLPPDSIDWANNLLTNIGDSARAYLPEPLCAIFVNLNRWQIEVSA